MLLFCKFALLLKSSVSERVFVFDLIFYYFEIVYGLILVSIGRRHNIDIKITGNRFCKRRYADESDCYK